MFKVLLLCVLLSSQVFGHWHWGGTEPKKGQLIMFSLQEKDGADRVLMMTHYDPKTMKDMIRPRGWWDVNKENLWEWVYQNYRIYYIPRSSVTHYWEDSNNWED